MLLFDPLICCYSSYYYYLLLFLLRVKSVVILKANPGILKLGGEIKMWMWLCVERGSYLEFGDRVRMKKIGRNIARQKRS